MRSPPAAASETSANRFPVQGGHRAAARRTSSCTRIPPTRSSTARRCRRSSPRAQPSSATTRLRSPTTTASTARSSSHTLRSTSVSARSPAPRSALRGGAHITLLCETRQGYANLCRILTDAHAGTREPGKERDLLPAETTIDVVERHAEGLVALSGCARNGLAVVDAKAAGRLARAFPGAFSDRAAASVRAGRREAERAAESSSPSTSAFPPSRPATCMRTVPRGRGCRTHSLRSSTARRSTAASASGAGTTRRCCSHRRRCSSACPQMRPPAPASSPTAARFDLTQELGYRYPDFSDGADPADRQLERICESSICRALPIR